MADKSGRHGAIVGSAPQTGKEKRLLDQVRGVMRLKHYSFRTEQTYCDWVERFIRFHRLRHPPAVGNSVYSCPQLSTRSRGIPAVRFLFSVRCGVQLSPRQPIQSDRSQNSLRTRRFCITSRSSRSGKRSHETLSFPNARRVVLGCRLERARDKGNSADDVVATRRVPTNARRRRAANNRCE